MRIGVGGTAVGSGVGSSARSDGVLLSITLGTTDGRVVGMSVGIVECNKHTSKNRRIMNDETVDERVS